ncbi:MAG TPA: hypothetical protein VG826_29420 [Pirellulales bacterium]|nr:hypothetical protein [Pirellulales bacterium]
MTVFDLVFIVVFFSAVAMLMAAGIALMRRRRGVAVARLRRLGVLTAGYVGMVVLVSLVSPRRVLRIGDEQCWDDWCIAVTNARCQAVEDAQSYEVTFRLFSRARRRPQRELGVHVYLMDDRGRCYEPVPDGEAVAFDVRLLPQESVDVMRRFNLPADGRDPVLVVSHEGWFPGSLVIGDSESLFHKRTVVQLFE